MHKGVRGVVKDKNGKPIVGAIIVLNGGVRVFTSEGGYFHALLAPGLHNIEASADGYQQQSQKVSFVVYFFVFFYLYSLVILVSLSLFFGLFFGLFVCFCFNTEYFVESSCTLIYNAV